MWMSVLEMLYKAFLDADLKTGKPLHFCHVVLCGDCGTCLCLVVARNDAGT